MQDLFERASTIGVATKSAIRERLEDFELFTALFAAVLVGGHSAIYQRARGTVVILTPGVFRPFQRVGQVGLWSKTGGGSQGTAKQGIRLSEVS